MQILATIAVLTWVCLGRNLFGMLSNRVNPPVIKGEIRRIGYKISIFSFSNFACELLRFSHAQPVRLPCVYRAACHVIVVSTLHASW